jgi:hypothetical protein
LAVLLAAMIPTPSIAFELHGIGPRVGSVDPEGGDATFAAGMHLDFEQAGSRVHLLPNVLFWGEGGLNDVNPNFDVMYHFGSAGQVSPYVGTGVGVHFYTSDGPADASTDLGGNFFGGVLVPVRPMSLFLEAREVVSDRNQFGILTGMTFPLGH